MMQRQSRVYEFARTLRWTPLSRPFFAWDKLISAEVGFGFWFPLGYSWVWWCRSGRHEPKRHTVWTLLGLVYHALLPVLLFGLLPYCFVPRSYALTGLPLIAIGLALAFVASRKLRPILASYGLLWFLIFAASIPTPPRLKGGPQADQTLRAGVCGGS